MRLKIIFKLGLFFFFILFLKIDDLLSQQVPRIKIQGKISDESTGAPIAYVNVFLSNTTLGDVTDQNGYYVIERVPLGVYELVVSMMGYELKTRRIYLNEPKNIEFNFSLRIKYLQVEEISISSDYLTEAEKKLREKNLKKFETLFFGTSENASKSTILNPEYLNFTYDEATGLFIVSASKPIQIENRSLGYFVSYFLLDFVSIDDGELKYSGRIKFDLLPSPGEKEKLKWRENQISTYNGSFQHFLSALASGNVFEEGFEILGVKKVTTEDTFYYLDRVTLDTLLAPGKQSFEKILSFSSSLSIIYGDQTSAIVMNQHSVMINTIGQIYNPYALTVYGAWAQERIADKLPSAAGKESRVLTSLIPKTQKTSIITLQNKKEISPQESVRLIKQANSLALKGDVLDASIAFYNGLKNLGNHPYTDTLFQMVQDIMSEKELNNYKSTQDKSMFFFKFWQKQDATPATLENERLVEHWQRYDYVKRWYRSFDIRGYDDRGEIYLRYGKPDDIADVPSSSYLYPNEGWFYHINGRSVIFDFYERNSIYQLVSDPREMIRQYFSSTQGVRTAQIAELQSSRSFLPINQDVYDVLENIDDYSMKVLDQINISHLIVTDLEMPKANLQCGLAQARFYLNNKTRLEIYYGIPSDQLELKQISSKDQKTELIISYTIRDSISNVITPKIIKKTLEFSSNELMTDKIYLDQINEYLQPGDYQISLEIKEIKTQRTFAKSFRINIPEIRQNNFMLSDIELASNVQLKTDNKNYPALFVKENLVVTPFPSSSFTREQPVLLYFEVYNLSLDRSGLSSFEVEYKISSKKRSFWQKINPFTGKGVTLSSVHNLQGNNKTEQQYLSLDISKIKPGDYQLSVLVKDKIAGLTRSSNIQLKITE